MRRVLEPGAVKLEGLVQTNNQRSIAQLFAVICADAIYAILILILLLRITCLGGNFDFKSKEVPAYVKVSFKRFPSLTHAALLGGSSACCQGLPAHILHRQVLHQQDHKADTVAIRNASQVARFIISARFISERGRLGVG